MEKLTQDQIKTVKAQGFLFNNNKETFAGRVITENGVLNGDQLKAVAEASERFGNGTAALTTRLTIEIQGIHYEDIPNVQAFLAERGLAIGGTGAKVRPIVACKGTVCVFGLADTQSIATKCHKRFFEGYSKVVLPHKFKIAIGGCPNNCVKPDLNDVGIVGQMTPAYAQELCRGCKKCVIEAGCPMKAAKLVDGKLSIAREVCSRCGRCVTKCPFHSIPSGEQKFKIYIGGRWGKKTRHGSMLSKLFTLDEAIDLIEKSILLFKDRGLNGERFGETVDRLGIEEVEKILVSNDLFAIKNQILAVKSN